MTHRADRDGVHDGDFAQGQHVCSVYDTREEQLAVAAGYMADGLARSERCLYACDSLDALDRIRAELAKHGVDAAAEEFRGALLLLTSDAAHLEGGSFDGERMLRMLNEAVEAALDAGFTGLRTCGDMSWLLRGAEGSSQALEYEALLNQFFPTVRATGMCQYDRSRLPPHIIEGALARHPWMVDGRRNRPNPAYQPSL
ncbi:MAG TPA: MEDS domain-containing protein [Vicinamibacterales bacterium]